MLQSTWPALAMGHQISPGLRNIVSHMPREGCLEMDLKTPSFLCRSHPTVKTIRLENKHSRLSDPKIESRVEPFFRVWLLRWCETCPPSPGNGAETTRWAKIQGIKLYKVWRESIPQAEMAFHLPDSFFFIRDLGKDRTVHPRAAWTGTAGLTHPLG